MRLNETEPFAPIEVAQKSYVSDFVRLFYITMKYKGLSIRGLHHYEDEKASMVIRIMDVFKVVDETGIEMNQAETVTVLNDMFLIAPGSLIDPRITWQEIDNYHVKAIFTNQTITISAVITFDEDGRLVDFLSEDRYAFLNGEMLQIPWSTPITEYKEMNGLQLPYKGSAIWHFEDHDYEYIQLLIEAVQLNQ